MRNDAAAELDRITKGKKLLSDLNSSTESWTKKSYKMQKPVFWNVTSE